ncbi:metal ABC transporter solute-binding protein, Zn/Mn family [Ferrimonas marina]|uniref:High-affinity zinc uptake system protein ZnuA n=1 Tax=Ferrimonas marina TaxID=299255 RepID=A0A1M5VC83_9GAMM|nr:zinc ABC transporter substrate-binding protein [Ferrimonas marina]SHH72815.1 zinc transport system substrate-binding protein [Ferrimonas marina]
MRFSKPSLLAAVLLLPTLFPVTAWAKLKVGITLHPYYSYVAAVVGDKAEIVPLVDAGFNPHNYLPQPGDLRRLSQMDAIVVNGIGHDEFAMQVIASANRSDLAVIEANVGIPLLPAMGASVGDGAINPHTFVGIATTIQKVYTIAAELGKLDPDNAAEYRRNARAYARELRQMKQAAMNQLNGLDTQGLKVATTHNAYGYLLQEFGIGVDAVIEPAHGVEPSASQLQGTIERIQASGVNVLFYELDMPNRFVDTIQEATGVRLYQFSHMTHGPYDADKVIKETGDNLDTLVKAIHYIAEAE